MTEVIPKIIHQTWKTNQVPHHLEPYQKLWKELHPDWEYKMWTDTDLEQFIRDHYPWFLNTYLNYPYHIQRVDVARYFILNHYGGLYADLDYEPKKCFDHIISDASSSAHVFLMNTQQFSYPITNALMISSKHHPFWNDVFKKITDRPIPIFHNWMFFRHFYIIFSTGPQLLNRIYNQKYKQNKNISILEWQRFDPISKTSGLDQNLSFEKIYGIHHRASSWCFREIKCINKLQLLGDYILKGINIKQIKR